VVRRLTEVPAAVYTAGADGRKTAKLAARSAHHIVADPTKLAYYEVGALADYIALLALSQLVSLDICQALSSIVNLLAPGCAQKPNALTDNDLAYLRGLYKMGPGRTARVQQDEIAYQMEQALKGK